MKKKNVRLYCLLNYMFKMCIILKGIEIVGKFLYVVFFFFKKNCLVIFFNLFFVNFGLIYYN